jgi:hypothetical protein
MVKACVYCNNRSNDIRKLTNLQHLYAVQYCKQINKPLIYNHICRQCREKHKSNNDINNNNHTNDNDNNNNNNNNKLEKVYIYIFIIHIYVYIIRVQYHIITINITMLP